MKNKFFRALFPAAVFGLSIMLTAYAANSSNAAEATVSESTTDSETSEASDATDGAAGEKEAAGEQDTSSDEWYSDRDMEQTPDTSEAQTIEVADGQTLSITEEGTYILQGTASDCTVLVNAPEAKVQLILDNKGAAHSGQCNGNQHVFSGHLCAGCGQVLCHDGGGQ